MRLPVRWTFVLLGLAAFTACQDAPTTTAPDGPGATLAKGGNKPNNGGGNSVTDAMILLGKALFEDENLSVNQNLSCQSCHHPNQGFAAPLPSTTTQGSVVQGSETGQFGNRKPPSAAYATGIPNFSSSGNNATGGNFWDGRATGELLGTPAADQAMAPFLNLREQALPDAACVVWRVQVSSYAGRYAAAWSTDLSAIEFPTDMESMCTTFGNGPITVSDRAAVQLAYENMARSIAAFETTFNVFDSKFDRGQLNALEQEGASLFGGKGKCQQCHDDKGSQPLFTDFGFHNLGVPANPNNPAYDFSLGQFDPGLGGFTGRSTHIGKFKTPTVRNVAEGGANRTYMHNGALVSLRQVVQLYNTRDILPTCTSAAVLADPSTWGPDGSGNCWPPPEYPNNLDTKRMGNLGLTSHQVDAIVAFMVALTDLSEPPVPQ